MGENEIERVATRAATKAIAEMLPHFEAATKKIVKDARDKSFMAATGEEWDNRASVKEAIQFAMQYSASSKRFFHGFWGYMGSSVVGAIIAGIAYTVGKT